jgi:hypothetical protein
VEIEAQRLMKNQALVFHADYFPRHCGNRTQFQFAQQASFVNRFDQPRSLVRVDFDRRSDDLVAEVVRFLICWMREEKLLQKATPNAFASKRRKQRFDFAPQKPALRYLRFLLLILFSHRSLGVA